MAAGKRYDTSEPLTEHDVAARLNTAAQRTLRILWDVRQLGLAQQVRDSRYLTHDVLGILRAELDQWGVEPAPFAEQLEPLTPEAQAVADAYARWLSSYRPTGAPMSEQSTEQQPEQTVSTQVQTDATVTGEPAAAQPEGEQADGEQGTASDSAEGEQDGAQDGGSAE